jgi:acetoin utilization protein AcuC
VLDRDVEPSTELPRAWLDVAERVAPGLPLPSTMTEEADVSFEPWGGATGEPVDIAIRDTRRAVFPLYGLDPDDPRD